MATSTCTLNGIKYNNAAGQYGNWANYSYKTSGAMYAGWAGAEGLDCAMVFKITVPAFTGISSSFSITMGLQNQVDNGGPTTLNWSLATTDSYVTGNKYADGVNYPLTSNGEFDRGTVSLNFRYASYTPYTLTFNTSQITSGGTYYLILYRYDKTGISTQYPTSVTFNYKNTYTVSYNANGGSGAPSAQTKVEGTNLTLSSTKPTKASSVTYPTGTITISYAANGGSSTPSAGTGTYTNQKTVPYSFSHWNTASNNGGTTYYAGGTYTANAGATLYAQYSAGSATETRYSNPSIKTAAAISRANDSITGYEVRFNANGGSSTPSAITSTKTRKYTFAHWKNTSSGSTFSASTNYTFSVNATLTAQWSTSDTNNAITLPAAISRANASAGSYTVTFNANGGSCDTASLAAARTTKYTFGGWNTNSSGTGTNYSASSSYTPSAATTLYAKWSSSTSTAAITLPTPTRTGYDFKGWSTSSSASSGSTGSYTPTGNITLYAIWSPITYEVKYNGNGATSGSMSNSTHTYDVAKALTANAFTRAYTVTYNYNGNGSSNTSATATATFNGWATSASGSKVHNDKASVTNLRSSAGTYNLYANWTLNSVTLPTPTRTGYSLAGWYTAASGGTKVGAGGASYTPSANITLYAQWTENTYYVYYKNGLATGGTLPGTTSRKYTANATIATNSMSKSNTTASGYSVTYANGTATGGTLPSAQTATDTTSYTANGWTTGSSSTNDRDYANGATYGANTTNNLTLYPNFTTSLSRGSVTLGTNSMTKSTTSNGSYTVTLNANGGTVSSTSLSAARTITYAANGWTTTSGSTTRNYTNGQSVQMTAALTLYPCFTQTNVTAAITLPTPTRTGYTFKGWSTSSTATTGTTGSYTPTGNATLYATWQANSYKLTISAGTGSTITVSRTSSPNVGASTGTVSNNGTIYEGDVLKITFSISDDRYKIVTKTVNNSNFTSGNSHTVTSNVSVATTTDVYSYTIDSNKHYIYIYNGSSWDKYVAYIYNGSTWEVHGE